MGGSGEIMAIVVGGSGEIMAGRGWSRMVAWFSNAQLYVQLTIFLLLPVSALNTIVHN